MWTIVAHIVRQSRPFYDRHEDPMKLRRCLIPADGFYEWHKTGKTKQPYCFEVNDGELFASQDSGTDGRTRAGNGSSPVRS